MPLRRGHWPRHTSASVTSLPVSHGHRGTVTSHGPRRAAHRDGHGSSHWHDRDHHGNDHDDDSMIMITPARNQLELLNVAIILSLVPTFGNSDSDGGGAPSLAIRADPE